MPPQMNTDNPSNSNRPDTRILKALFHEGPMSAPELVKYLQYRCLEAIDKVLHLLAVSGQIQRVGLSNQFRLSPLRQKFLRRLLTKLAIDLQM